MISPLSTSSIHPYRTRTNFPAKFREAVGGSTVVYLNSFWHILARVTKTLYLFGDIGRSYTVQMEMVRDVEALDGVWIR